MLCSEAGGGLGRVATPLGWNWFVVSLASVLCMWRVVEGDGAECTLTASNVPMIMKDSSEKRRTHLPIFNMQPISATNICNETTF